MFARNVFGLAVAGLLSIAPAAFAAETMTVDIVSIRGGGSYVEIVTSKAACTTGGVSPDWADRPRISYGSSPALAESVQNLAIAALLSGRPLKIKATTSGSHCLIDAVWLMK
jgi:hypothetical protein